MPVAAFVIAMSPAAVGSLAAAIRANATQKFYKTGFSADANKAAVGESAIQNEGGQLYFRSVINSFKIIEKMKRLFILLLVMPSMLLAQKVGIGTNTPTEKLDVNGNMNITGALKTNGVAGQPGQVLTTNNAGNLQWNNLNAGVASGYNKFVSFYGIFDSVETWTIPAGINRIMVEGWGGGGGGSLGSGGAGGGYVQTQFNVNPGTTITVKIGAGGIANVGTESGQNGGNTIITAIDADGNTWYAVATGGVGAYNNAGVSNVSSYNAGGSFFVANQQVAGVGIIIYPSFTGAAGEAGYPTYVTYSQISSGVFLAETNGGRGGDAGNSIKTGGGGARDFSNNNTVVNRYGAHPGVFGGGGGGGIPGIANGRAGGRGKVIIWY